MMICFALAALPTAQPVLFPKIFYIIFEIF
jgi:hypothetical protein